METTPVMRGVDEVSESTIRQSRPEETQQAAQLQGVRTKSGKGVADQGATRPLSEEALADITDKMNQVASLFNTTLNFSVDQPTGKTVIKVMDQDTEEVIRQIPPENMLKLMSNMRDVMGMLLDVEI